MYFDCYWHYDCPPVIIQTPTGSLFYGFTSYELFKCKNPRRARLKAVRSLKGISSPASEESPGGVTDENVVIFVPVELCDILLLQEDIPVTGARVV